VGDAQLRFSCGCSREKVVQMLRSLGAAEIDGILTELGSAEVTCHFCNEVYRVEGPELLLIRDSLNQPEA
jgi:molecular chaperone Hsp33